MNVPEGMTAPSSASGCMPPAPGRQRADRRWRRRCRGDATPARFGRTRRCRDLPALGRRLGAASGAGRRDHARGQAGGHETPAPLRGDHRRDELRPQAPVARQGRAAGGGLSRQAAALAHHLGCGRRPARRDRLRPDRPRPDDLRAMRSTCWIALASAIGFPSRWCATWSAARPGTFQRRRKDSIRASRTGSSAAIGWPWWQRN